MHKKAKNLALKLANKNLNYINFWFNINQAINKYNKNINKILDSKIIYFWNRKQTIFDIINNVIKNKSVDPIDIKIFNHIMSNFYNRSFFRHIYSWYDKSAFWLIKFLNFSPLPSPID